MSRQMWCLSQNTEWSLGLYGGSHLCLWGMLSWNQASIICLLSSTITTCSSLMSWVIIVIRVVATYWCSELLFKLKIWKISVCCVPSVLLKWKSQKKCPAPPSPVKVIIVTTVQNGGLWCWHSTVGNGEKGQGKSWFARFSFQMVPCQYTCHQVAVTVVRVPPWLHPALASCRQTYCTAILASSSQHGFHKSTRRLSC